jgi:hypothetical protein
VFLSINNLEKDVSDAPGLLVFVRENREEHSLSAEQSPTETRAQLSAAMLYGAVGLVGALTKPELEA